MLVNSGASADPFLDGQAHGGYAKATDNLVKEVVPHIKRAFEEQSKYQKNLKLVITGHSMGAAVGIMAGMQLKQSSEFSNVECWGYSTPACVTLDVARGCKDFATSFIAHHDVVPRFSITALELLRKRICDFDWESADKIVGEDDDWSNIRSAADTLKAAQAKQKNMYKSLEQAREGFSEQVHSLPSLYTMFDNQYLLESLVCDWKSSKSRPIALSFNFKFLRKIFVNRKFLLNNQGIMFYCS